MDHIISKLLIYGDMPSGCILMQLGDICKNARERTQTRDELVTRVFQQVKRILEVATDYGFDRNLWHNYLTFLLMNDENPFSLTCEKVGAREGSVNFFAKTILKRSRHCSGMTLPGWSRNWELTVSHVCPITDPSGNRS